MKPSSRSKKTVVKAVRLTEDLDRSLQAEAESKGITASSLISLILTRYETFDRPTERAGYVRIIGAVIRHMLNATSDEEFKKTYPIIAGDWISAVEFMTGQKATFESFWTNMEAVGSYGGLYTCNAERSDDGRFRVSLRHTFGKKWSEGLESVISDIVMRLGARELTHSSTTETVLISGETPSH